MLLSAGPTEEPLDEVRFLSNRSSGLLGQELALAAERAGWSVTALLAPRIPQPIDTHVRVHRFRTSNDLDRLLRTHLPDSQVLIMAAAVCDYRPINTHPGTKLRRHEGGLSLELEAVDDLLRSCAQRARPDQVLIGFSLSANETLESTAREKLEKKGVRAIVANPLQTMDAQSITPLIVWKDENKVHTSDWGLLSKSAFAERFIAWVEGLLE